MFSARLPISFIVRGSYNANCDFQLVTSETVLLYDRIDGQPEDHPIVILPNDYWAAPGPWSIEEVPMPAGPRVFRLSLSGSAMNELLTCDPMHPLLIALFDQLTIPLSINMGPVPPDGIGPQVASDFIATLFLKLTLHVA